MLRRQHRPRCTEQLPGVSHCPAPVLAIRGKEGLLRGGYLEERCKKWHNSFKAWRARRVLQDKSVPAGSSRSRSVAHIQMRVGAGSGAAPRPGAGRALPGSHAPQVPRCTASPIYNCMHCRSSIRLMASHRHAKCCSISVICSSAQAVGLSDARTLHVV